MIRIPDAGRFELRLADGSTNPYLLQASLIAAGLDGLAHHRDPGKRCDNNMYTEPLAAGDCKRLPSNLLDALRALRSNAEMIMALGAPFVDAYTKLKEYEWHEHNTHISAWERAACPTRSAGRSSKLCAHAWETACANAWAKPCAIS